MCFELSSKNYGVCCGTDRTRPLLLILLRYLEDEGDPAVEADVGEDDLAEYAGDAEVTSAAVDRDVGVRAVLVVSTFVVNVDINARPLRVKFAAAEREAVLCRIFRSATDTTSRRTVYQSDVMPRHPQAVDI